MAKKVSVIIPTYNYEQYIKDAIESVIGQSYPNIEIIVVDDGSVDNTKHVVESYGNKIIYIYQNNAGLSAARNTGIKNSSGEYILFLDSDDLIGKDLITNQVYFLERNIDSYISVCKNKFFSNLGSKNNPLIRKSWRLYKGNLDIHLCYLNIAPPHAFFFRRRAVIDTGWFDTKLKACEDYDFIFRAAIKGFTPKYNPNGIVYYRRHHSSMSADLNNQYLHDAILHLKIAKLLKEKRNYPKNGRFEGLMLSASGAICTYIKLKKENISESKTLIAVAYNYINEAKITKKPSKITPILLLSYIRIMKDLSDPVIHNTEISKTLKRDVHHIIVETILKAPLNAIISLVLKNFNLYFVERREILNILFEVCKSKGIDFRKFVLERILK